MMTPVFRGLKELYGQDCHVTCATDHYYLAGCIPMLLRHNPFIDEIVRVNPNVFVTAPTRHVRQEFKQVPNKEVPHCVLSTDLVIDLNVVCALTETAQQPNVTEHRTDIWCRAAGVSPSSRQPILCLTKEEREEGQRWVEERLGAGVRVGVVLSTVDPARDWPHATAFAWDLLARGYKVVTIDKCRPLHPSVPAMLGMHIRQVAAAVEHLDIVVTPDTGILHVAGALGVPVLGIFGPTDGALRMREYAGSWVNGRAVASCSPCWYLHGCQRENPQDQDKWWACMKRVSCSMVRFELERLLERFGKEPPNKVN